MRDLFASAVSGRRAESGAYVFGYLRLLEVRRHFTFWLH